MRWLALLFVVLIAALQYPMWLGKGGWLQVRETDRQLAAQREENLKLKARNEGLDADVRDLKTGSEAIEERARSELGMIRNDEVFFQVQPGVVTTAKPPAATTRQRPSSERTPTASERTPPASERTPPASERTPPASERTPPASERTPPASERSSPATTP